MPFPMTFRSSSISWPSVASETESFTSTTGWRHEGPGPSAIGRKCVRRTQSPNEKLVERVRTEW